MEVMTSWEKKGWEAGLQQGEVRGRQQGELNLLKSQVSYRLGKLSRKLETRLKRLTTAQLEELGKALFDFKTMTDLTEWLETNEGK